MGNEKQLTEFKTGFNFMDQDKDGIIISSFKAFDQGEGTIDPEMFQAVMMGKGDPLTKMECNEIFPELPRIDEQPHPEYISIKACIQMLIAKERKKNPGLEQKEQQKHKSLTHLGMK